jgi:hypothetical protein
MGGGSIFLILIHLLEIDPPIALRGGVCLTESTESTESKEKATPSRIRFRHSFSPVGKTVPRRPLLGGGKGGGLSFVSSTAGVSHESHEVKTSC